MNAKEVVQQYVGDLTRSLEAIEPADVEAVIRTLDATRATRARVFVVGNGGSAATASHLCTDLSIGLKRRGLRGLDIQSLSDNAPIATAISNDIAYEEVFSAQLEDVIAADDVLLAISASGNSPNILAAVECAKRAGATVIGVSGFDGGALRANADVSFHVPTPNGAYGLVEDVHLVLNHILHTWFALGDAARVGDDAAIDAAPAAPARANANAAQGWRAIPKPRVRRKWQPPSNVPG